MFIIILKIRLTRKIIDLTAETTVAKRDPVNSTLLSFVTKIQSEIKN